MRVQDWQEIAAFEGSDDDNGNGNDIKISDGEEDADEERERENGDEAWSQADNIEKHRDRRAELMKLRAMIIL